MSLTGKGPLGLKAPKPAKAKGVRKVSKKRAAHMASPAGKAEMAHMAKVKQLPCIACYAPPPSDAHHVIHGRFGGRKPDGFHTIPLCKRHHQDGPEAIHNGKAAWAAKHGPDYGFLPLVRAMLDKENTIDF